MEVILLEKTRNLGDLGDKVKVKAGYGRNYLIPYGKAVSATAANVAAFEARRAELEAKATAALEAAQERAKKLQATTLTITVNASEEGKLYGSVGTHEIMQAFSDADLDVAKREIQLDSGAIHNTGEYDITLQLHSDVLATVKLVIVAA